MCCPFSLLVAQYAVIGFHELIPEDLVSVFNERELELLISGMPNIDLADLQANTEYHSYT